MPIAAVACDDESMATARDRETPTSKELETMNHSRSCQMNSQKNIR